MGSTTKFRRICALVGILYVLTCCADSLEDETILSLQNAYSLLSNDIQLIKTKLWVETATKLQLISKQMESERKRREKLESTIQRCQCADLSGDANEETHSKKVQHVGSNRTTETGVPFKNKYTALMSAFTAEKKRSVRMDGKIHELHRSVETLGRKYTLVKQIAISNTNISETNNRMATENRNDITALNTTCASITSSQDAFIDVIKTLSDKQDEINNTVNSLVANEKETKKQFQEPGFVSEWFLMKAQDSHLSNRSIPHNLGDLPVKVEVQIKPTSGPNAGWIFTGDSAFLADDDLDMSHGGIVYLYNNKDVILFAPRKNNGPPTGKVVYTGADSEYRLGNNHQKSQEAYVRVKVWGQNDTVRPDYVSEWLPLDIFNESRSYYDIQHGLAEYPAMVNVQIQSDGPTRYFVSEGIGASMRRSSEWSNGGGTVWGYNNTSVRVWTAHVKGKQNYLEKNRPYYSLAGSPDGWGYWDLLKDIKWRTGKVRILAWSNINVVKQEQSDSMFYDWYTPYTLDPDRDLVSVFVKANDGKNAGYYFKGFGNSQSTIKPFGGLVYAFSPTGQFRLWPPNPVQDGHLININEPYGNGANIQASDNATYVMTLIKCRK